MAVTEKNHENIKTELRLFYAGEIGKAINRAGSMEKLSMLLGKSSTYVRMTLSRETTTEKLESLYNECKEAFK